MSVFPFFAPPVLAKGYSGLEAMMSMGQCTGSWGARSAGIAWPSANLAMYFPFRVFRPTLITGVDIFNGGTVSGNGDIGIYSQDGILLTSTGSTALTGANASQTFDFADITLGRGNYYVGVAVSNTTHTFKGSSSMSAALCRVMGALQQATAFPLPTTMTPATFSNAYLPVLALRLMFSKQTVALGDDIYLPPFPNIYPFSLESLGGQLLSSESGALQAAASGTWPAANDAVLIPFFLSAPTRIQRLFCYNGATAAGNIDLGIYAATDGATDMTLLVSSGSTAQSGTNTLQTVSIDITIGPGTFYFGLAASSASATFFRNTLDGIAVFGTNGEGGMLYRTTSFPLPTTITTNDVAPNFMPVVGLAQGTVI